jgi:trigger factor
MKKRILALLLGTACVMSLVACSSDETKETSKTTSGKITLGDYKGFVVGESVTNVSDDDLQGYVDYILQQNAVTTDVKEGTLKADDVAKITFKATIDGKEAEELSSAAETSVTLSAEGAAINGFTDALIGKAVGTTNEFDLTIQSDFSNTDYAGKTVHFSVTVNAIAVTTTPELTDAFVEKTYAHMGYKTISELKEYLKNELYINQIYKLIWTDVLEKQKVVSYDTKKLAEMTEQFKSNMEQQIYTQTGADLAAYLKASGTSEADFMKDMENQAKASLKEEMFLKKVIEIEKIKLTDEEYNAKMTEYAKTYGYSSVEEFSSAYATLTKDDFEFSILSYKAQEFICKSVKVVPDEETTADETKASEATTSEADTATEEATSAK